MPPKRRAALPSATRCVRCQQHHERPAGKRQ
ncbi:TraR/DksA C4-type zinc finger protein [Ensifer sp. LC384]|nr:TraR/DksA C4-type zinc finger protein [Ensifer sp. LC384]